MRELEERIRREGVVRPGDVLKVDTFLNHGVDVRLYERMGAEWARRFSGTPVDKVLTIEASGIGLACVTALALGGVPVVFARKTESANLDGSQWRTRVHSYTHGRDYEVIVERRLLARGERVLVVDDFLANGAAMDGLLDICDQAGAVVQGVCVAVEKGFQPGGARLRARGLRVESLARVASMDAGTGAIEFIPDEGETK